ncbi:2-hydroxycarboxylate transporter family protein [uncultured Brachyspira sp.]|uniref:2-hydroxycarboxylate transporter family protein n=1 Tax=uncultured Brachyspira sp. TaxID=221953 RepID=UPI0027DE4560|nr:2-hydroxycarboxylate transporter family protein [uncultured Brachyspira sp.]
MGNEKQHYKIMGIRWQYFLILLAIYLVAVYIGKLPQGMIGALGSMLILGALFDEIGNKTPIIKDFLGGGAIVAIFAGGLIVYFKVFPENTINNLSTFMAGGGFLDFYIAALICGSIFGMSRNFLIKAFIKYLPLILASTLVALIFVAIGGLILGYEIKQSILYIGLPIMGGGDRSWSCSFI